MAQQTEIERHRNNGLYWLRIAKIYASYEPSYLAYLNLAAQEFDTMDAEIAKAEGKTA